MIVPFKRLVFSILWSIWGFIYSVVFLTVFCRLLASMEYLYSCWHLSWSFSCVGGVLGLHLHSSVILSSSQIFWNIPMVFLIKSSPINFHNSMTIPPCPGVLLLLSNLMVSSISSLLSGVNLGSVIQLLAAPVLNIGFHN